MKNRTCILAFFIILISAENGRGQVFDLPQAVPLELHKPLDKETMSMQRSASLLENRGEYEKALNVYFELFGRFPEYGPFYDGVVRGFIATAKYEEGLAWVDSLKGADLGDSRPEDLTFAERERLGNLIVDGGRFCGRLGRRDEAFEWWEDIYSLPHTGTGPYIRLFTAMIDARYSDGLEEMAKKARRMTGNPSLLAASLANYWATRGQIDQAVKEWLRLMEVQPRQAENVQRMILGLPEDEATWEQIEASLKSALSHKAIKLQVIELLGSLYFRSRQWEDAYEQVRLADQLGNGNGVALLLFAENLNSEGEHSLAMRVLEDLEQSHPGLSSSSRALLSRAQALEAVRAYHLADSVYTLLTSDQHLRTAQGNEALIRQAKLRLNRLNQPSAARSLLEDGLSRNPRLRNRDEAALLIGDTHLAERNLDSALESYLEVASGRHGRAPEIQSKALVNAAQTDFYQGNVDQAMERLKMASESSPDGALTNDALDMLEMLRSGKSDSIGLAIFAYAELEFRLGCVSKAESLFVQVSERPSGGDLAKRAHWRLADLRRKSGRSNEAIETLEAYISRFPKSLRAPEVLLKIGEIRQTDLADPEGAVESYERILMEYPQSLQVEEARRRIRKLESPET